MPKYICKNKDCKFYNQEVNKSTILRIHNGEVFDSGSICEECGKIMDSIKESEPCTTFHGPNTCNS